MLTSVLLGNTNIVVYRDDLNHATVSGNKLHKLKPNIELAKERGCGGVLSFGGPYSNHLHALAWACKNSGLKSVGFVRGELHESLTPTLNDCRNWGMTLVAIPRNYYRDYQDALSKFGKPCLADDVDLQLDLKNHHVLDVEKMLVIPEGGSLSLIHI